MHRRTSTTLERFNSDGLLTTVVTRPDCSCRELFIFSAAQPGQCPSDMFRRAGEALRQHGGEIVAQQVFGFSQLSSGKAEAAIAEGLGPVQWPVTWVDDQDRSRPDLSGTLIHAIDGLELHRLSAGGRVVGTTYEDQHARYCMLGDLRDLDTTRSAGRQAEQVFQDLDSTLRLVGMDFSNVVRTWFWNRDILSWYDEFNKVRTAFFQRHGVFDRYVPASTGIGSPNPHGAALVAAALAMQVKDGVTTWKAIPSPLQCPALDYGSSFSRAAEIATPDYRWVLVSGTASIWPDGRTAYVGDMAAQVKLTMEVVEAILKSREMDWEDVIRGVAYILRADDARHFYDYCRSRDIAPMPVVPTRNVVCRGDLLFEIEIDAMVPTRA